jgi:mannose/cellobiose epimerase-like protein (N-acyl-D-glucosamine 2-epimerase family)
MSRNSDRFRLHTAIAFCLLLAATTVAARAQTLKSLSETHTSKLQKVLIENIQNFWLQNGLDKENGGYIISYNNQGKRVEPYTKMIVTQARQVWLHSRLARAGYNREQNLAAAEWGYRFLTEKMWDKQNGGFYWEVDVAGKPTKTQKHLYGQSFGLYALSEYYLATKNKKTLDRATELFYLLEAKAHDSRNKGYREMFSADWSPVPEGTTSFIARVDASAKLYNTHLHLLESMTSFYRASRAKRARERLLELIDIETDKVVRKELPACTDVHDYDWKPKLEGEYATVSYGHDLENIWLVIDACEAADIEVKTHQKLFVGLFDYAMTYGVDNDKGGFFNNGPFNEPATGKSKVWWVQAEALVAALWMHRLTGDSKYLEVFARTWDFVEKNMIDWEHGEWYESIAPDGQVRGAKASIWKAGYHNGRSMIECIEVLKKGK